MAVEERDTSNISTEESTKSISKVEIMKRLGEIERDLRELTIIVENSDIIDSAPTEELSSN